MNLHQRFLTENNCYKAGKRHTVRGIMVHSTGANNPRLSRYVGPDDGILGENKNGNHWNTPNPGGIPICVHAFIGKDKNGVIRTYQTLPWDMVGWHSGIGALGFTKNANNTGYVGFEICEDDLAGVTYFNIVYKEAVELCAMLCQKYKLDPIKDIICHSEGHRLGIASNHADVMHWFPRHGKSMDDFRKAVAKALVENKKPEAVQPKPDVKPEPVQPAAQGKRYSVQAGAFSTRVNAETLLIKVRSAGFVDAYITED